MSATLNGNGNGNGRGKPNLIRQLEKRAAQAQAIMPSPDVQESRVSFQTSDGVDLSATLTRVTRHAVYFEVYSPSSPLRFSEVLEGFNIILQSECIYSGRATVRNVLDAGTKVMCEATLRETDWKDSNAVVDLLEDGKITAEFKGFLGEWQKFCKVSNEFKVVVADMRSFLNHLQLWLGRMELQIKSLSADVRETKEQKIIKAVAGEVIPFIDALFEKFEHTVKGVPDEQRSAYGSYTREHLHPLVLNADFARRTYEKPLGYPGDYEMVNMILRNGFEGNSIFAKVVHAWFVKQPPAEAHRNRITYLTKRIELESRRMAQSGKTARIYNFACGPAVEVQDFLRSAYSEKVEIKLVDFNTETIEHTGRMLAEIKSRLHLRTNLVFERKSVHQLLKNHLKDLQSGRDLPTYDLVYCAGLFDYLPDATSKQLMNVFYDFVAPGGMLLVTNVDSSNPLRFGMEYLLDWHLIYRTETEMRMLRPDFAPLENVRLVRHATAVTLFLEIRKPAHG